MHKAAALRGSCVPYPGAARSAKSHVQSLIAHYALEPPAKPLRVAHRVQTLKRPHIALLQDVLRVGLPKGFGGQTAMVGHCETLAKTFDTQASEYKAMAEAHRQMAK